MCVREGGGRKGGRRKGERERCEGFAWSAFVFLDAAFLFSSKGEDLRH